MTTVLIFQCIHYAARHSNQNILRKLVEAGASVNAGGLGDTVTKLG
jgi:hypothetical protein